MKISCPKCGGQMNMPEGFSAGKYNCPHCKATFMCDASGVTYLQAQSVAPAAETVRKNGVLLPKRRKMTYAEMKRKTLHQQYSGGSGAGSEDSGGDGTLCFWMGALFWVLGLVIAAIIGKGHGVKMALLGMVVSTLVIVLGYGLLLMLAMAH